MTRIYEKVVKDSIAEHGILNTIVKSQSDVEKCENLCGSEKIETTNDIDEYDAPSVSLNYDRMIDLNYENSLYFNSSISDCDISMYHDFDFDTIIQEEDSKDNEKTIQDEPLTTDHCAKFLTRLRENFLNIDSEYEKICRTRHDEEKFVDSGISLTNELNMEDNNKIIRRAIDNYDNNDLQDISEKSDVICKTVEEDIKNKKIILTQNDTYINIEESLQENIDIKNVLVPTTESNNYFISNNGNYFKDSQDFSKNVEENAKHTLSTEEDSIEKTITIIKKMDKIIKNLCSSDDEHDSAEETMIESLSAKMENDHDDVMRKIIESCSHVPADFQQHSPIREIPSADLVRSNSEYVIKKFRENELFPHHCVVSETAIAKEEILKTIEEAKKILINGPCWDTSEINANQTTANYNEDNSSEKPMRKVENEKINETINKKEIDFIENNDTKINSANTVIEEIAISESDIVESNLQKLAEIIGPDRLRSRTEIRETLKKIAEEKKKIEDRKKESLKMLSKKFEEIDKLVADHNNAFHISDLSELKTPEDVAVDSDSLNEFQVPINPENFEVPLTKFEITENLKIEELEKELADEIEEHKKLMDEYQKIIATDLEKIQLTLELKSIQACNDNDEEIENEFKDDEIINEESSNEASETNDITAIKIDSEFDDSFTEEFKESEKTYIKGKTYDFDEKKHGVR